MSAQILDGKALASTIKAELATRVVALKAKGITPGLGTVLVGDDPGSHSYVGGKHRDCQEVGINSIRVDLPENATEKDILAAATPEFLAVLIGLVLYTGAFVAEIVRSGIQAVSHGQVEAATALGLTRGQQMRLVILPQALRVIVPPMTSQYLNLTKNSSLAVAVGYPDVVSVANTTLNQSGRAVECIAVIMVVYLSTSLSTSAFMNWYNKRVAIKER